MKKFRCVCVFLCLIFALFIFVPPPVVPAAAGSEPEKVFVGGFPIGIAMDVGGLLVESVTGVSTEYGVAFADGIERGDIILSINGVPVRRVDDVYGNITGGELNIMLIRGGEEREVTVRPIIEAFTLKPRLGIKIKDKIYGVGTCTFVRRDGSYAALGHEIYDGDTGVRPNGAAGAIHACRLLGVKKGCRGEAGAILASVIEGNRYGTVSVNNGFGIAGKFEADIPNSEQLPLCPRSEVCTGPAKLRTCVENVPEYYDIEIIKASRAPGRREKSIVFRVTDKRLLAITGGVVRGMSGSPIIQNGRIVGAVTHVFLNDFTKGYGVYADCLN